MAFSLSLTPDLGFLDANDRFDPDANALVVVIASTALTPTQTAEGSPGVKSFGALRLTLGGAVYEVPLAYRRLLKSANGQWVLWQTTDGESGSFRYYRRPLAVF